MCVCWGVDYRLDSCRIVLRYYAPSSLVVIMILLRVSELLQRPAEKSRISLGCDKTVLLMAHNGNNAPHTAFKNQFKLKNDEKGDFKCCSSPRRRLMRLYCLVLVHWSLYRMNRWILLLSACYQLPPLDLHFTGKRSSAKLMDGCICLGGVQSAFK